jgi:hypothetical protein
VLLSLEGKKNFMMTLKLLTGEAHDVSNEKYQYQFTLGADDIVLTSKIEHCVNENDQLTVVGYFFNEDKDCEVCQILGVVAYFNHTTQAKSDNRIPFYIFLSSLALNIFFIVYSFNLYLQEIINYQLVFVILVLSIINYLGYFSTRSHLILNDYLKKNNPLSTSASK